MAAIYRPLPDDREDQTPLLQPPSPHKDGPLDDADEDGSAGLRSSVANLCNTILGTGMLAMPHAVAAGGLVPGVLTIFASGSMAALGLYLLALCAQRAPYRQSSFFALSQITYPKAAVVFDAAIAIKCFGVSVSYLIILGSLIPKVAVAFASTPSELPPFFLNRAFWILLCIGFLTPLCFLRRLHSLRFISYFALFAVADLLFVVAYKCFDRSELGPRGRIEVFRFSSALASSIPVYVFAYTCAQNLHPVHNELRANTQARMNSVIGISIGSAAVIYQAVGLLGYITFGSKVTANIMDQYPASFIVNQCRFMIVFFVMFSYPLQVVLALSDRPPVPRNSARTGSRASSPALETPGSASIPTWRFTALTVALLVATTLVSLLVHSLEAVLGIVGATGSTTISFLLPSAFYLKLFPAAAYSSHSDVLRRVAARVLLVLGFLVMSVCLGLNIYEWVHPHKTPGRGAHSHPPGEGHLYD